MKLYLKYEIKKYACPNKEMTILKFSIKFF